MIRITLPEKVSKSEKQSVLDNPDIRVGAEFEIEKDSGGNELPDEPVDFPEFANRYLSEHPSVSDDSYVEITLDDDRGFILAVEEAINSNFGGLIREGLDLDEDDPMDIESVFAELGDVLDGVSPGTADISTEQLLRNVDTTDTPIEIEGDIIEIRWSRKENDYVLIDYPFRNERELRQEAYNWTQLSALVETMTEAYMNYEDPQEGSADHKANLEQVIGDDIVESSNGWHIESDASLTSEYGFELITPEGGLPLNEFLPIMEGVFNYIDEEPDLYTSNASGFHVNLSIKGVDLQEELDQLKLALFVEEGKVYQFFEGRENNKYTASVLKQLRKAKDPSLVFKGKKKKEYQEIVDSIKNEVIPSQKYYGINFSKLPKNYVEFRYLGGEDYHTKYQRVRSQILDFAYFLRIATDPDAKWEEYTLKLNRLIDTIDDGTTMAVENLKELVDNLKDENFPLKANRVVKFLEDNFEKVREGGSEDAQFKADEAIENVMVKLPLVVKNYAVDNHLGKEFVVKFFKQFKYLSDQTVIPDALSNYEQLWDVIYDTLGDNPTPVLSDKEVQQIRDV